MSRVASDRRTVMRRRKRRLDPGRVTRVPRRRIVGREERVAAVRGADAREVAHEATRIRHGGATQLAVPAEHEVGPQRAAEETHAVHDELVVVEHAHVRAGGEDAQVAQRGVDARSVELVVSGHVERGLCEAGRPGDRLARAGDRRRTAGEVQVGEYLETQGCLDGGIGSAI
jgi:hypothetical protein